MGPQSHLLAEADADAVGEIDWQLSIDSTISRVHQHGARPLREAVIDLPSQPGGLLELQRKPVEPATPTP